jgi:hypothetical protein
VRRRAGADAHRDRATRSKARLHPCHILNRMDGRLADRLRLRILAALACGSACTGRGIVGDDGGAGDSTSTTEATADDDESRPPDPSVDDGGEEVDDGVDVDEGAVTTGTPDDDGGVHFDLGGVPDVGGRDPIPPLDCDEPPVMVPEEPCSGDVHDTYAILATCVSPARDGSCSAPDDPVVIDALQACASQCLAVDSACALPATGPDTCCYWTIASGSICPGRPFMVCGRERLADVVVRDDWRDAIAVAEVPAALRDALARAWTEDARCEHAAVASFARFTLQLLAVGAPAELVARAQRAGADELAHARAFFGLASAYAGAPVGPGVLDTADALADGVDLERIVLATVREGCIAETISVMRLATALAGARDPAVRDVLARIVEEEIEHVELAWAFVDWALTQGDVSLRAAVARTFAASDAAIPRVFEPAPADASSWCACGRLDARTIAALDRATLRDVVDPCARRLLAHSTASLAATAPLAATASPSV